MEYHSTFSKKISSNIHDTYCDSKAPMERMIQFEGTVKVTVNQGNRCQITKSLAETVCE